MKRSRRNLSSDMIIHNGIFKNNHSTLCSCFPIPYLKRRLVFTMVLNFLLHLLFKIAEKPIALYQGYENQG